MSRITEGLRTAALTAAAIGIIGTGMSAYAFAMHNPTAPRLPAQFDSYLWAGIDHASEALQRDLNLHHPAGTDAAVLLARLERGGFECRPQELRPDTYDCSYRRPLSFDRVAMIRAEVVTAGTRLVGVNPPGIPDTLIATPRDSTGRGPTERNG